MFIGIINAACLLTYLCIFLSLGAIILSYYDQLELALICLIYAGIGDLFDGFVARKLKLSDQDKAFGRHIDTIADTISFGVTPCIILLHSGFTAPVDYGIMGLYLLSACIRLAHFDVHNLKTKNNVSYFTGLPVTYIALFLPVSFIFKDIIDFEITKNIIRSVFIITALLFVLKISIPKPKGILYPVFLAAAIGVTFYWLYRLMS